MLEAGLVHLYYGNGKGKTTAAIGLGIRACGRGKKILLVQFLKGNKSGEILFLETVPSFRILRSKPFQKFIQFMTEEEKAETIALQKELFQHALIELENEHYDLVILDEIIDAVNMEILSIELLRTFLHNRKQDLEVVLTGHNPKEAIFDLCDYVTEIKKVKHPYDRGVRGRIGIEM